MLPLNACLPKYSKLLLNSPKRWRELREFVFAKERRKVTMTQSILTKLSRVKAARRYVGKPLLFAHKWIWNHLPSFARTLRPVSLYGNVVHLLVRLRAERTQYHGTCFLRNRPELELLRSISSEKQQGSTLRISVLACSNGAEVYSIVWAIRSARPDLKLIVNAIEISNEILEIGKRGSYSPGEDSRIHMPLFARLTDEEMSQLFDKDKDHFQIKAWITEGIHWQLGDARDPSLADRLGPQDIVVANRFLCHMSQPEAESCLRSLAHLVNRGGYLFVSGIDLDVRTKVALDSGWTPVQELLEEIHDGDQSVRLDWPLNYWGLEPLDRKKKDWQFRYAAVFRLGCTA